MLKQRLVSKKSEPQEDIGELKLIQIDNIVPNRNQPRKHFDKKNLEDLAESIAANGLLQPITVRLLDEPDEDGKEYELIAGERRWRAHEMLSKKRIPAIITQHSDADSSILALIENLQRADLSAVEEAEALKNIMQKGKYTQATLAEQIGKSRSYVTNLLRLLTLPEEVKAMIEKKQLESWHGLNILSLKEKDQIPMARKAVEKGWSIAELKTHIDKATGKDKIKEEAEAKKQEERDKNEVPKYPIPNNYILIKIDDESEIQSTLDALHEGGLTVFLNEDIKTEIRRVTSPLLKINEERKAAAEAKAAEAAEEAEEE